MVMWWCCHRADPKEQSPHVFLSGELCVHLPLLCYQHSCTMTRYTRDSLCDPAGIMLGRMGDSGTPLVSFCQCLNESVMKIVAVAGW